MRPKGRLTRTRQFVGTLRYASPEQVFAAGAIDRRTDIYSLGATFWELLTLRPIYDATDQMPTPELMRRITSDEPERIRKYHPRIASDLEAIVSECLEKDPNRRYATAGDLSEELARWQRSQPVTAHPPTLRYVAGRYVPPPYRPIGDFGGRRSRAAGHGHLGPIDSQHSDRPREGQGRRATCAAQRNFERARDAVDQLLTEVGEVELADVPQMEPVRKRLLAKAQRSTSTSSRKSGLTQLLREEGGRTAGSERSRRSSGSIPPRRRLPAGNRTARGAVGPTPRGGGHAAGPAPALPTWVVCSRRPIGSGKLSLLPLGPQPARVLASENPDDPDHRQALADCRYNLGTLLARATSEKSGG